MGSISIFQDSANDAFNNRKVFLMKTYFFIMTMCHYRTFDHIGKITGVVQAESEEEAIAKAWDLAGNDACCSLQVQEMDLAKGFSYVVYKSEI